MLLSDQHGAELTDADLSLHGIEPSLARRYFWEHYGLTFHARHRARRMRESSSA